MHYFVSYPKSGRTWLCFMYHHYLARMLDIQAPTMYQVHRSLKSKPWESEWLHLGMEPREGRGFYHQSDIGPILNAPVLFLTRDIHDTLVSYYHHIQHRESPPYTGTISNMLRDPKHGAIKICCFYRMMQDNADRFKQLLTISYEELHRDCRKVFEDVIRWAGLFVHPQLINETVRNYTFEKMQELGNTPQYEGTALAPTSSHRDSAKVRKGKVGAYRKLLSGEDMAYIRKVKELLL